MNFPAGSKHPPWVGVLVHPVGLFQLGQNLVSLSGFGLFAADEPPAPPPPLLLDKRCIFFNSF